MTELVHARSTAPLGSSAAFRSSKMLISGRSSPMLVPTRKPVPLPTPAMWGAMPSVGVASTDASELKAFVVPPPQANSLEPPMPSGSAPTSSGLYASATHDSDA